MVPARALRPALGVVFALLALQGAASLAARVLAGGDDRLHPALHLASGLVGLALLARPRRVAAYAVGFGTAYAALGVGGAVVARSPAWLPLGAADHVFHVGLGAVALALGALLRQRAAAEAAAPLATS